MDPALHDRVLIDALTAAEEEGVAGKEATPFVLGRFHAGTGGESLRANVALVLRNAALAARIAGALAG
jgi:pseudouridine-5'-phosphate glycosidase